MMGSEANIIVPLANRIRFNITLLCLCLQKVGSIFGRLQLVSRSSSYGLRATLLSQRLSGMRNGLVFPLASLR